MATCASLPPVALAPIARFTPPSALSADLLVAETDILFVNETEALQLSNEPDVAAALAYLGTKTSCVVIKCGSRGAMGIRNGKIAFEHGFPVQAIDTTEAGDSVAAGFVRAYLTGSDLPGCLEVGNACGAMSTLHVGGTQVSPLANACQSPD